MRTELCLEALQMAIALREPQQGLIHHSDRGSQYASLEYQRQLSKHGMECSMSRKGNCWDNSVTESFFGTLKEELVYRSTWENLPEAKNAIEDYIVSFYNRVRIHSTLGNMSPVAYESSCQSVMAA